MTMDDSITRKTVLFTEIIQGKTTVAETSLSLVLAPSDAKGWIEDAISE